MSFISLKKAPTVLRIVLAASVALLVQFTASAHTALVEAMPAVDSTTTAAPAHLDLTFSDAVKLVKFELMGVGHEMPTKFEASADAMANFRIETPGMHPGKFTVNWAVIGADGHTVANSYSFTVDPDAVEAHADHDAGAAHGHGAGGDNPH